MVAGEDYAWMNTGTNKTGMHVNVWTNVFIDRQSTALKDGQEQRKEEERCSERQELGRGECIKEPTEFFKWLLSQGLLKDDEAADSLWFVKKSPFFLCLPVKLPVPVSTLQSLQQQNHHFKFVITFETASAWFYTLVDQSRLLIPTEQLIYGTCAFSCCPCRVT